MLRLIEIYNSVPSSFPVKKDAEFQPGNIGQLYVENGETVIGVSDGSVPFGILDDIKTPSFSSVAWDEVVIAKVLATNEVGGKLVSKYDTMKELSNPNINASSFVSIPVSCQLMPKNGVVVFPAGTELNYKAGGCDTLVGEKGNNAIKTIVRYTYTQSNIVGDDSTKNTGMATVWVNRGIFSTDIFDTNKSYPVNAMLFVSTDGKLTTRNNGKEPTIGIVISPPTKKDSNLRFLWI